MSSRVAYRNVLRRGCWGWIEAKRHIHVWISGRASLEDAVGLVAHELGHAEKPWCGASREERKAAKYESVAMMAVKIVRDLRRKGRR